MHSWYDDHNLVAKLVKEGDHRHAVGGLWDQVGALQLEYLIQNGMKPSHRLLDIGCGSLRLGAQAAAYLEADRYFGVDASEALIEAGWRLELDDREKVKVPRTNLSTSADFDFGFVNAPIDYGIAQSVFTHLPLNHLRRCLFNAAEIFNKGGLLFVTAFLVHEQANIVAQHTSSRGDIDTHDWCDPYHYWPSDFQYAASRTPWQTTIVGDWGHPRGQSMVRFERR